MSIKLNIKDNDIVVYDNVNLKHATNNEVVFLTSSIKGDLRDTIIDIISDSIGLNDSERELYKCMTAYINVVHTTHPNDDVVDLSYIIGVCANVNNKSITTYRRAVDTLVKCGVIKYYQGYIGIMFNKEYDVNNAVRAAKYIVIEIKA